MVAIHLDLEGDGAFPDLAEARAEGRVVHLGNDSAIWVTALENGTAGGRPSVALRIDLPDGRVVLAETTLRLFLTAADALKARFGDPR